MSISVASPAEFEQNLANRIGCVPGYSGDFIAEYGTQTGAGVTVLYTVAAGYRLMLFNSHASGSHATLAWTFMLVANAADVAQYVIHNVLTSPVNSEVFAARSVPLIVEEGYKVTLSGTAGGAIYGGFEGILVPYPMS